MDKRELFQIFTRRFGLLNKNCCNCNFHNISLMQSHILYEIRRQQDSSMQQVAESLGMDITTFSRQIQSLVRKKLVEKNPDPNDRRINLLSLTAKGRLVEAEIDRQINTYLEEIFSHLSKEEQDTVTRSVLLLNQAMLKSKLCCLPPF